METQQQDVAPESKYPLEYSHIEQKVQNALEKIHQFDEKIKTMPNDRGPDLSYNPPGFMKSRQLGSRDQYISSLEKAKAHVKTETWQEIQQLLKEDNTPDAKQIRDLVREDIYPNDYKSMDEADKKEHLSHPKDIEQSQDFMRDALDKARNQAKERELNTLADNKPMEQGRDIDESQDLMDSLIEEYQQRSSPEKEAIEQNEPPQEKGESVSISQRFSQSLGYSKALDQTGKNVTPTIDKESPDRD
jgi:hypothetical protein